MPDWFASPPPPPDWLPGGWWTAAGALGFVLLLAVVSLWRRLRRPAPVPMERDPATGEPISGDLIDARSPQARPSGKPEGRHPCPPGLPVGEEERLRRVRAVADFLDNSLKIPGVGFAIGWDSVIGLAPGVGDAVTGGLAVWIIVQGGRLGVPKRTLMRMCGNAGLDIAGGAVPGVGDAFDVVFKANRKNLRLIEIHLAKPPKGQRTLG